MASERRIPPWRRDEFVDFRLLNQLALADCDRRQESMSDVAADLRMRLADHSGSLVHCVETRNCSHVAHVLIVRYIWQLARRFVVRLSFGPKRLPCGPYGFRQPNQMGDTGLEPVTPSLSSNRKTP